MCLNSPSPVFDRDHTCSEAPGALFGGPSQGSVGGSQGGGGLLEGGGAIHATSSLVLPSSKTKRKCCFI